MSCLRWRILRRYNAPHLARVALRSAQDQATRQGFRLDRLAAEQRKRLARKQNTAVVPVLVHRGKRRDERGAERGVVVTDYRDILGNPMTQFDQRAYGTHRKQIVAGENRIEADLLADQGLYGLDT